jgi:hypothetical protein
MVLRVEAWIEYGWTPLCHKYGDLCERLEYGFMVELATSTQKAEADVQGYYRLVVRLLYRTSWVAHFVPSAETLDVA